MDFETKTERRNRTKANKAAKLAAFKANRRKILDALKASPCTDCATTYPPYVMDFDHVSGKKKGNIGIMAFGNIDVLMEEIAKCELVCSNCHRIRTHNRARRPLAASQER